MKLVWSPEMASKAYIDTVKSVRTVQEKLKSETWCKIFEESSVAELVSAMAAGWNARLIVETWSQGGAVATSIGLALASHHTGGRHVCIVPDEKSRLEYIQAMEEANLSPPEMEVGEPEEVMGGGGLVGIDFLVVDSRRRDFARSLRVAKLGHGGAVLVCKNACSRSSSSSSSSSSFRWRAVLEGGSRRLVRSVFLPVGKGLDIAHVGIGGGSSGSGKVERRWIKHVDRQSGEEFVIRK